MIFFLLSGTIHEVLGVIGHEVILPCSSVHLNHNAHPAYQSDGPFSAPNSHQLFEPLNKQTGYNQEHPLDIQGKGLTSNFLRYKSNRHQGLKGNIGSQNQDFILRSRKVHPFMRPSSEDKPILVLWYKDGLGTPIYRLAVKIMVLIRNLMSPHSNVYKCNSIIIKTDVKLQWI